MSEQDDYFAGKTAVITGSAVGIGRSVAITLARLGMNIGALDIDVSNNQITAGMVAAAGASSPTVKSGFCVAIDCDISEKHAAKAAIDSVAARFGSIDLLVNNAGYWDNSALTEGTFETQTAAFDRALGASALGAFYCTRAAVDHLRASGGGNVISMITDHVKPGYSIAGKPAVGYDSGKFAMWRQTETWAIELAPHHIRVNGLCFGAVDTPMLRAAIDGKLPTEMEPEDIAQAVVNIVAHGAVGPTGETWLVAKTEDPREVGLAEIAALAPR